MRWFYYILSLLLIWLICSADGCNENASMMERIEENQIASIKDTIRDVFETGFPDEHLLRAYEESAKQRLADFADYLKISSDSSVDIVFRKQAAEMAGKLFKSPSADVSLWVRFPKPGRMSIDSLLLVSLGGRINSYMIPVQTAIHLPLKMESDSVYQGSLLFYPQQNKFVGNDTPETGKSPLIIEVYALKKVKHFGKESLTVWEVLLGDIRQGR